MTRALATAIAALELGRLAVSPTAEITTSDYVVLAIPAAVALALAGILGWWLRSRHDRGRP